jgi:hypothetical protein
MFDEVERDDQVETASASRQELEHVGLGKGGHAGSGTRGDQGPADAGAAGQARDRRKPRRCLHLPSTRPFDCSARTTQLRRPPVPDAR